MKIRLFDELTHTRRRYVPTYLLGWMAANKRGAKKTQREGRDEKRGKIEEEEERRGEERRGEERRGEERRVM